MKKSLLKIIPVIDIKKEWISLIRQFKNTDIEYLVAAENKSVKGKKIVILSFINKAYPEKIAYRVFINKENYITQDFTISPMKWRTGRLEYILSTWTWAWYKYSVLADDKSHEVLESFLGKEDNLLEEINLLQYKIMDMRLAKKHQKIKDRIDKKMKTVPRLPNNFKRWINDTALYHSRYIYYEYKPRKFVDGYCTHCKSELILDRTEGVRHNKEGICPRCKSLIIFKAIGKAKNVVDYGSAALIQKVGGELLVRYFSITKFYKENYRNPELVYTELARDFYNKDGKVDQYEYTDFKQTNEIRWCDNISKYPFYYTVLYEKNLTKELKGTPWEYSAIREFAIHEKGFNFPVWAYLTKYRNYPQIEYLVKLGLYRLTDEIISNYSYHYQDMINLSGDNLYEVLKINSKEELKIAQRLNAGLGELKVIRETSRIGIRPSDEEITFISENIKVERIVEISKYTTFYKMIRYVNSQLSEDRTNIDYIFSDWLDYIKDCKILGYDLTNDFVLFPRDLAKTHDETYKLIKDNKSELFNSAILEMYEKLMALFNWDYKDNIIITPKSADEIIKEGQELHHCVGRYVEDVARGETIILFLRRKMEINKPFYTIEINPVNYEIKQCRGKNNASMDKEVKRIIDRFEKERLYSLKFKQAV